MSVNKVQLANGETIIDISESTVTPETLAEGVTAHDASGQKITGKMVPGGGTFVQTDWNQTDETAADFIKNKPFGNAVIVDIVPETEVTGVYSDGIYQVDIDTAFSGNDETLVITFDGVAYSCAVNSMNDFALYGNMAPFGEPDTGEPFLLFINPMSLTQMLLFDGVTHKVSIGKPSVETIAEEYLPVIPLEKVPGSIKLYVDGLNYLYEDSDTSDHSKRITRKRLRELLECGQAIYIQIHKFITVSPIRFDIQSDYIGYSEVHAFESLDGITTFYTAEYTPET